jgi:isocitrate dehydrogenase
MEKTILAKKVTYDFERMMDGADLGILLRIW